MLNMFKRLVKLSISAAFWFGTSAARRVAELFGGQRPATCVILYYHVVRDDQRERFARQMDELLKLGKPISLERQISLEMSTHHVLVTFDDAFKETITNIIPELESRGIPVTVFVPTGCLGLPAPWLDGDEYEAEGGTVMNIEELKNLTRNSLVTLGSHCATHRPLPDLPDREARNEVFGSKELLERLLGRNLMALSFPHGAFEQKHVDWARQAGYGRAFSSTPSWAFAGQNEFVTGRVRIDPTDWPIETRLKMLGAYNWIASWKLARCADSV